LAKITPNQVRQVRQINDRRIKTETKFNNIQTAFTFGRKISRDEVSKSDFAKQFDDIKDELNRNKRRLEQNKRSDRNKARLDKRLSLAQRSKQPTMSSNLRVELSNKITDQLR